ncbi:MAG TPA: bifunctional UDP-N-acetylglucosamine diphosphorylase/glucosamine-1-phosphate N-acetyltransferase GlmU [Dehalococcoidia bacterium]|nr:bifunctional UDP-N-acetylglucosamine diphosphorylase/glucosamine-1-phosphate N-acetyltransferase GlmU [Dehalococcoidia bacterium]
MSSDRLGVVVLAAGKGTRMRSRLPKPLHTVCGIPMVSHITASARSLDPEKIVVVVGHGQEDVREELEGEGLIIVEQPEQLGTGNAVQCTKEALGGCDWVMVLNGDTPLITPPLLAELRAAGRDGPFAFATSDVANPGSLGRVQRDDSGAVKAIVEAAEFVGTNVPGEINAGQYVFRSDWLWPRINSIRAGASGESYLTDLIGIASSEGNPPATVRANPDEILGVDDRSKLAEAEAIMRKRILRKHMLDGVTLADPATTYIDASVKLAPDVTVLQGCRLSGRTFIAEGATIGPDSSLEDARVGNGTVVKASFIEDSRVGSKCVIGPFAHVRGGAEIGDGCELGNYSEVKNSVIGSGVRMHHFSYVGDAEVGEDTNIAAGTITCNYDGKDKHRTIIGKNVFIGSDTMLVAPITVGDGAATAAGAVVIHDVPAGERVAGVPAKPLPVRKEKNGR